jgi:hypothetical protein
MSQAYTGDSSGCPHRRFETREVMDYWEGTPTGDFEQVDVSPCQWDWASTFSDKCKTCGRIERYSNANPDVYNDVPRGSGMSPFKEPT